MQTKITADMPFGVPGTHANGQPFRADAYEASAEVTFGSPVYLKQGKIFTPNSTEGESGATYIGMAVGPEQHVLWKLPDDVASISVPKGEIGIGVAARGSWIVRIPFIKKTVAASTEGDPDVVTYETEVWAEGDGIKVGYDANNKGTAEGNRVYQKASGNDTVVGHVVKVVAGADTTTKSEIGEYGYAIVRLGE